MSQFGRFRKSDTTVLPSGVEMEYQTLVGRHQKMITTNNEAKRKKGFIDMMTDCIKRIGSETDPKEIEKIVKVMLTEDIRMALIEIRQLSNSRKPDFNFTYEFPIRNGKRRREQFNFEFTSEQLKVRPYPWVLEVIKEEFAQKNDGRQPSQDELDRLCADIPVVYSDYHKMIQECQIRKVTLPESGVEVEWSHLNQELEERVGRFLGVEDTSSHTMLEIRKPTFEMEVSSPEGAKHNPRTAVPLDELGFMDIEHLRGDMLDNEGKIDTTIVVQYKDDPSSVQQLDLVTIPAFFFPSMAN